MDDKNIFKEKLFTELKENTNIETVPNIFINKRHIGGFVELKSLEKETLINLIKNFKENLDGNISFDMSESSGSFSQDSVNHKKGNGKHDASHDRKNYSYVNAIVKECSKFCEGRPLLWDLMNEKIEEMHSAIIREYKILNDSKKRTQCDDEQNSNTLVSSNLPIEKCPGRKRYKSYHQKF